MRKIELFIIYFPENVLREGVLDRKFFLIKGKYEVKIFEGIVEGFRYYGIFNRFCDGCFVVKYMYYPQLTSSADSKCDMNSPAFSAESAVTFLHHLFCRNGSCHPYFNANV